MASLFYRKDRGCWYGQATVDGVRKKQKLTANKKESELLLAQWVLDRERQRGLPILVHGMRLKQFYEEVYRPWAAGAKSKAMLKREDLTLRTWYSTIGDLPLSELSKGLAARFQAIRRPTCTARTVNLDTGVISHVLNKAVEWSYLELNPLAGMQKLRETKSAPRWLTSEEIGDLMKKVPERLRAVVITFLNTGLRKGELLRLEWADVDLAGRYLTVRHKGEQTTKGKKERMVDLNDLTVDTLRAHRSEMLATFGELPQWVFVTKLGSPMQANLYRDLKKVFEDAGIKDAKIHSLRHTFGAQAVMAGMDLPTLKQLMGHSDISTTMVYAHVDREHVRKKINCLALGAPQIGSKVASLAEEKAKRAV